MRALVFIMGRRPDVLQKAVKTLGRSGAALQGDVTSGADLDRAYAQIKRDWNHLNLLFANAAAQISGGVGQIEKSHYDLAFGTNIMGTIYTVQKALPPMRRGSSIVRPRRSPVSRATPAGVCTGIQGSRARTRT